MSTTIDELQIEIEASSSDAASAIDKLSASLGRLKGAVKGGSGLTTTKKQLEAFSTAVANLTLPGTKIAELVASLKPLEDIGKSNLGAALNQLKKIPEVTAALESADMGKFAAQINEVVRAVKPLADEMEKVNLGFSRLPANIKRAINANAKLTNSNAKLGGSWGSLRLAAFLENVKKAYTVLRRVSSVISDWIHESTTYVESLNLFTASMGKFAEEAQKYAEHVGNVMGIDPAEWMRNQGVFMTLATGFGVAADNAALMSKNLTQLGYDLGSFFNIPFADSMQKLQSGISGELEPLRRLGYDLSQARLKQIAFNLGIEKSITDMTQAEKSQLRYHAILMQVTTAQGDMARTLNAPANQLRILSAQATQAARALGNIFVPALNAILPYAIAFLQVVRKIADEIANLFGFSLPEIDYSGVDNLASGAEDASDALDDAAANAKKLKDAVTGIDELNILNFDSGSDGLSDIKDIFADIKLPEYDFLGDALEIRASAIAEKMEKPFREILKLAIDIGAAITAWKFTNALISGLKTIVTNLGKGKKKLDGWDRASRAITGVIVLAAGVKWSYEGGFAVGRGTADFLDFLKFYLGPIASGVGGALIGSAIVPGVGTGVGFAIGLTLGIVANLVAKFQGAKQALVDAFYASDIGQGVAAINERMAEIMKVDADLTVRLANITGEVDDATMVNMEMAQRLINEIFEMDAKDNKTAVEIAIIQDKIKTLNGLNLEGLQGMFQTTTDSYIIPTKDAVQDVIDKMLEQYKVEALREDYIAAYKVQNEALKNMKDASGEVEKSMGAYNKTIEETDRLTGQLAENQRKMNEYLEKTNYSASTRGRDPVWQELVKESWKLKDALDGQKAATEEAGKKLVEHKETLDTTIAKYGKAKDKVDEMSTALSDLVTNISKQVKPAKDDAGKLGDGVVAGYSEALERGRSVAAAAAAALAGGASGGIIAHDDTHSPSRLYWKFGLYAVQGYANAFKDNAYIAANAASNMATSVSDAIAKGANITAASGAFTTMFNVILKKLDAFSDKFRNSINSLLSGMATSMNGISMTTDGKIRFAEMPKINIPMLADGAVIPPRRPFAAILGDQQHGRNIETPEGVMRQVVREESGGGMNEDQFNRMMAALYAIVEKPFEASVEVNETTLARMTNKGNHDLGQPIMGRG